MFSPDGRWIAYHSDEAGPLEVFVRSFPDSGRQYAVSTTGGQDPVWSRTSQELFYRRTSRSSEDTGGELYAVSYRVEGESLVFDRPRAHRQNAERPAINSTQLRRDIRTASGLPWRPSNRRRVRRLNAASS